MPFSFCYVCCQILCKGQEFPRCQIKTDSAEYVFLAKFSFRLLGIFQFNCF
ncbi:Uncharacterized protein TCM_042694 [Theobroma cacao]|uniref:Uncharacterized protein n=1 Tax=Theobroma cacao TaxID=3641 RepID=A0A061FLQ5_THECC|nr:Uncharacterized protein TCM_042694 [Theobroma cacao]